MKTITLLFKSLLSNQAAVDNRKMKWYFTLIVFLLSVFLPWIPFLSSGYRTDSSQVFKSGNYEVSTALKHVISEEAYFKDIKIQQEMEGDFYLDMDFSQDYYGEEQDSYNWTNEFNGTSNKALFKSEYKDEVSTNNEKGTDLRADYFFDCVGTDVVVTVTGEDNVVTEETVRREILELYFFPELEYSKENATYLANFTNQVILKKDTTGTAANKYRSYAFFLKDWCQIVFYSYDAEATETSVPSAAGSYYGNIQKGLKRDEKNVINFKGQSLYNYLSDNGQKNVNQMFDSLCVLFDSAARPYTIQSTWMNILITSIAFVASLLIVSIMVIIFFKKKNSNYRESNYFHAINVAVSMGLCPSIIGMIFGFFSAQMVTMIIVAANLVRGVYVMNKICPPPTASGSKPVYQARD